ncbi:MAG: hypothetical protein IKB02_07300, partial [Clostridia bacterium]|nr:hypothetical protein [Clostridia bacterium]
EKLSKRKCRFHEALLAAARSHFGSDNRTGLSFTTEMPLRYLELRELLKKLDQNFLILFPIRSINQNLKTLNLTILVLFGIILL